MRFSGWKQWEPCQNKLPAGAFDLPESILSMLSARGIDTLEKADRFLNRGTSFYDPFLMRDMQSAVDRIHRAVAEGQPIVIFGDFDCDGIAATAMLYDYLENAGAQTVYYIPDRGQEGYGLNRAVIDLMSREGYRLLITVDNGISATDEAEYAASLGIDVIITDHHQPLEQLPKAVAVLNPHRPDDTYPFQNLCGAGVVFKLLCALEQDDTLILEQYGDLLALATMADVVPLMDENRAIVQRGLEALSTTGRPGLLALAKVSGIELSEQNANNVTFSLVPRINAAGRVGSPDDAMELLLCQEQERAAELAQRLDAFNAMRKELETQILKEIDETIAQNPALLLPRIIFLVGDGWHLGVIGIVAARILERYEKPCFILSANEGVLRGSARSTEGFSVIDAVAYGGEYLTKYGGHAGAAGITLDEARLPPFIEAVEQYAREQESIPPWQLRVDAVVPVSELTVAYAHQLEQLAPFGCGNQQPVIGLLETRLTSIIGIGNDNHLRLQLSDGHHSVSAVLFGVGPRDFPFEIGETVDCAVTVEARRYKGSERLSLKICGIRPAGFDQNERQRMRVAYEELHRGELSAACSEALRFSRNELSVVFRYLRTHSPYRYGVDPLAYRLAGRVNLFQLLVSLDILQELCLLKQDIICKEQVFTILPTSGKTQLETSDTYRILLEKKLVITDGRTVSGVGG